MWTGRLRNLTKSVAIGNVIGVPPGTGVATAAFVFYAEGRRSSPNRAGFGEMEPNGFASSEAASNAVTGMGLGPTVELITRQGLILTDGNFFGFFSGHPIALMLALAAVGALSLSLIRAMRKENAG